MYVRLLKKLGTLSYGSMLLKQAVGSSRQCSNTRENTLNIESLCDLSVWNSVQFKGSSLMYASFGEASIQQMLVYNSRKKTMQVRIACLD